MSDRLDSSLDSKATIAKTEPREIDIKGTFVSHTGYDPDESVIGDIWGLPVYAWYPGEGEGTMSHMGKFYTFYNQYVTPITGDDLHAQGITVPITEAARMKIKEAFNVVVPSNVGTAMMDKQGNALFSNGTYYYTPIDYTPELTKLSLVEGEFEIVGGSGKFENATGHISIKGYAARTSWNELSNDQFDINGTVILAPKE